MGQNVLSGFSTYQIVLMVGIIDVLPVVWNSSIAIFPTRPGMASQSIDKESDCVPFNDLSPVHPHSPCLFVMPC